MPRTEVQYCVICGISRTAYDLKIEPGMSNPDYTIGDCAFGHVWGSKCRTEVLTKFSNGKKEVEE